MLTEWLGKLCARRSYGHLVRDTWRVCAQQNQINFKLLVYLSRSHFLFHGSERSMTTLYGGVWSNFNWTLIAIFGFYRCTNAPTLEPMCTNEVRKREKKVPAEKSQICTRFESLFAFKYPVHTWFINYTRFNAKFQTMWAFLSIWFCKGYNWDQIMQFNFIATKKEKPLWITIVRQ